MKRRPKERKEREEARNVHEREMESITKDFCERARWGCRSFVAWMCKFDNPRNLILLDLPPCPQEAIVSAL